MDYLRILLVPLQPTVLLLVALFSVLLTICVSGGVLGIFGTALIGAWFFKYCYVLIEHLADGAHEAPVLDADMISPFETRPMLQAVLIGAGAALCYWLPGSAGMPVGVVLVLLLPATVAMLGMGERLHHVVNPLRLLRVITGLGPQYLLILASIVLCGGLLALLWRASLPLLAWLALAQWLLIAVFCLIGGAIYQRRRELGFEPRRSPERDAARADGERLRHRARMIDEVFQLARIGRHQDATRPLTTWLAAHADHVTEDAREVATRALQWNQPAALEPIGAVLVRFLLRAGRADVSLALYDTLCREVPRLTLNSREDLMSLAAYAQDTGRARHAEHLRESAEGMRFWGAS